jgi:hypothetical protein
MSGQAAPPRAGDSETPTMTTQQGARLFECDEERWAAVTSHGATERPMAPSFTLFGQSECTAGRLALPSCQT